MICLHRKRKYTLGNDVYRFCERHNRVWKRWSATAAHGWQRITAEEADLLLTRMAERQQGGMFT